MRVVFALHGTNKRFGIAKYFYLLARELRNLDVQVKIVTDSFDSLEFVHEACGADVDLMMLSPLARGVKDTAFYSWNLSRYLKSIRDDFDVLHTAHVNPFFYLQQRDHKPVVFQPFGNELFTLVGAGFSNSYCLFAQPVLRYCAEKATVVVSEGEFQHEEMRRFYPKMKALKVLPVGVDTSKVVRKTDYSRPDGVFDFLAVNSFDPWESMDTLVDAFATVFAQNLEQVRLTIVGGGPLKKAIRDKAESQNLPVTFRQNIPDDELYRLYAWADAFVCSTRESDFQMGVLEAMATGLPVLTSEFGWVPPCCATFYRSQSGDGKRPLASAMTRMVRTDQYKMAEIGKQGLEAVKQYDFAEIAKRAVKIYEEVA
jgi:glycosyltransferase involved in cell wall biosynthesis